MRMSFCLARKFVNLEVISNTLEIVGIGKKLVTS